MTEQLEKAFKMIEKAEQILLITHVNPDGDALSSICALTDLLKRMRKTFTAYCRDEAAYQYYFLPHIENLEKTLPKPFAAYDLIITLDCGQISRTGLTEEIIGRQKSQLLIEFDHHPKVESVSDLEIRVPELSSTAELLYNFFKANNLRISSEAANCILTGIMTDTGNFMYPSTTDKNIHIASEMLLYGAKYPKILQNTWRNKSFSAMKIWGEALGNLQVNPRYNIAFSVISNEAFLNSNVEEDELEGVAGFLSNLYGVNGVLFLREEKSGLIRGSLRSVNPDIDVSKLAQAIGGGGHRKAAGFSLAGHIRKTADKWRVE